VGVPDSKPVPVLNVSPAGVLLKPNALALRKDVIWYAVIGDPWVALALLALVMPSIDMVRALVTKPTFTSLKPRVTE